MLEIFLSNPQLDLGLGIHFRIFHCDHHQNRRFDITLEVGIKLVESKNGSPTWTNSF